MPWKEQYTISDEIGLADADIHWPDGARCAVVITVDLNLAAGPQGIAAADLETPDAVFGMGQGLSALRRVLDRHRLRASFAVPAVIAGIARDTLKSLAADGHEIAANGFKGEDVSALDRDEEASRIARATELVAAAAGAPPQGWFSLPRQGDRYAVPTLSRNTFDLLLAAGYRYFGNSLADDIPHYCVGDFASRRAILALPYYYHFDDQFFLLFPRKGTGLEHADVLIRNWRAEFEAQYRRGRCFHMVLHPRHIGWASRLQLLDEFLAHLRGFPSLWNPTGAQCAGWWLDAYPAATALRLAPSIWQDHPGSLS